MKSNQTKKGSNEFRATNSDFWKKQHGYDDKKAEKASDWMSKHYSDLGESEAVKINESNIKYIVSEAVKKILSERDWKFDMMSNRGTQQDKIKRANDSLQQQYGMNQTKRVGTPENGGTLKTNVNAYVTPSGTVGYLSHNQEAEKDGANPQDNPGWVNGNTPDRNFSAVSARFEKGQQNPSVLGGGSLSNDGTENYNKAGRDMQDYFSGNFKNRMGEKMKKLGNYNVMPDMGKNFRK